MSTHSIFLNYRRTEAQKDARHLYRELLRHFPEQIFMDAPGTAGGQHFPNLLRRKVQECRVLVAVIGPEWHRLKDDSGRVRLQQEDDWVRLEIATALQRGIPVIPALIDGARMLVAGQVPAVLHGLLNHQALKLDLDDFFDASIDKLCGAIRLALATEPTLASPPRHSSQSGNSRSGLALPIGDRGSNSLEAAVLSIARPSWANDFGHDNFPTPWADFEVDGVVQRMRWVEPGSFIMGTSQEEIDKLINGPACREGNKDAKKRYKEWLSFEVPPHEVVLSRGFWLADTACTVNLWATLMGSDGPIAGELDEFPVHGKTFVKVKEFLQMLGAALGGRLNGDSVVLPTEAQWEYGCRAGTDTPFNFESYLDRTSFYANVNCSPRHSLEGRHQLKSTGELVNVRGRPPNDWGFYQMHGNVFEWCADVYKQYSPGSIKNPGDKDFMLPYGNGNVYRIVKGGAYDERAVMCRSAVRLKKERHKDDGARSVGFRIAILPSSASEPTAGLGASVGIDAPRG